MEGSFLVFQNIHVYRTKSAGDIDLTAFVILLVTNVFWMAYALTVLHGDLAVFVSGVIYTIGSSMLIAAKLLYGYEEVRVLLCFLKGWRAKRLLMVTKTGAVAAVTEAVVAKDEEEDHEEDEEDEEDEEGEEDKEEEEDEEDEEDEAVSV